MMAQGEDTTPPSPPPPGHMVNQCSLFRAKVTLYLSREDRGATSTASLSLYPNEAPR